MSSLIAVRPGDWELYDDGDGLGHIEHDGESFTPGPLIALLARGYWQEPVQKHADHDQSDHGNWARGAGGELPEKVVAGLRDDVEAEHPWEQGKGNCYAAALTVMMRLKDQLENPKLIHANVIGRGPVEGIEFGHAWVEHGPDDARMVLDVANGNATQMDVRIYRALGQAEVVGEYDFAEMGLNAVKHMTYGPWDDDE